MKRAQKVLSCFIAMAVLFICCGTNMNHVVASSGIIDYQVVTYPTKQHYVEGEKFDYSGLVIKVTYVDGTTGTLSYDSDPEAFNVLGADMINMNGYDGYRSNITSWAPKDLSVSLNDIFGLEEKNELPYDVFPSLVTDVTITKNNLSRIYTVGDQYFKASGLSYNVTYANGTVRSFKYDDPDQVEFGEVVSLGFFYSLDTSKASDAASCELHFSGITKSLGNMRITNVKNVQITGNYNTTYSVGQTFNATGLIAHVTYVDGTSTDIPYVGHENLFGFKFNNFTHEGDYDIAVTYDGIIASNHIGCKAKAVTTSSTSIVIPKKVTLTSIKAGKKKITVKYKKVSGCTYQIGAKQSGKGWKYYNTSGTSKTIKGLESKKKYSIKVRAKKSGKYGSWSTTKTVKVK